MYGFGDDRNPANDTVNVMEEILVEFITDVVRVPQTSPLYYSQTTWPKSVSNGWIAKPQSKVIN